MKCLPNLYYSIPVCDVNMIMFLHLEITLANNSLEYEPQVVREREFLVTSKFHNNNDIGRDLTLTLL